MSIAYQHNPRSYLHFDPPPGAVAAGELASSPERVARHSFYPFLGFTLTAPKVSIDENGQFRRKLKKRPIKLAAHLDAAIYAHYSRILSAAYEAEIAARGMDECVIAFRRAGRPGRSNISFAEEAFQFIDQHRPCVAIGLDIEKFFDRLDHNILKLRWKEGLGCEKLPDDHFNVFKSLTQFSWVERDAAYAAVGISRHNPKPKKRYRSRICDASQFRSVIRKAGIIWRNPEWEHKRGIPQGAPISALLSNVYMLAFDTAMHAAVSACGGLYRRYCDDIMIVVPIAEAARIEALAAHQIALLKLGINTDKTTRAVYALPVGSYAAENGYTQFLGFNFDGARKLIRSSSLTRYYGKMRRGVSLAQKTQAKHNALEAQAGKELTPLRTRQLYIRYSYLIRRRFRSKPGGHDRQSENFVTYAYRAAKEMKAPEIKKQVRAHFRRLQAAIKNSKNRTETGQ